MRSLHLLSLFLLFLNISPVLSSNGKQPAKNAILLSRVQSLTLRPNRLTTSRRLPPILQLTCTGPSKRICDMYTIETMRCTNAGFDYDEEDIQWTCTAPLPPELKLGSTDVICEGYHDADDKWVLKGSCGVEYRLLLTELGEKRFGRMSRDENEAWSRGWHGVLSVVGDLIFFGFIVAVFVLILWPMLLECFGLRRNSPDRGRGWGGFWGGGPGGGGGGGPYPGPPPPYSRYPESNMFSSSSAEGWRPGFWTGALGGGAAGYEFGRRGQRHESPFAGRRMTSSRFQGFNDPDEGSSGSSRRFSATTTGTGFGSTRRR